MANSGDSYVVVGLTNDEVASGGLSMINDTLSNAFIESSKLALANKDKRPVQHWATILMVSPLKLLSGTNETAKKYKGYSQVLFFNSVSMSVMKNAGAQLRVLDELDEPPKGLGIFINMPVWTI